MLTNYRSTPQTITGYQPSQLLLNRKVRDFIPDNQQQQRTSLFYESVKSNQQREYERSSKDHPKSQVITFIVGNEVIMKRDQYNSKFDSYFLRTSPWY